VCPLAAHEFGTVDAGDQLTDTRVLVAEHVDASGEGEDEKADDVVARLDRDLICVVDLPPKISEETMLDPLCRDSIGVDKAGHQVRRRRQARVRAGSTSLDPELHLLGVSVGDKRSCACEGAYLHDRGEFAAGRDERGAGAVGPQGGLVSAEEVSELRVDKAEVRSERGEDAVLVGEVDRTGEHLQE